MLALFGFHLDDPMSKLQETPKMRQLASFAAILM